MRVVCYSFYVLAWWRAEDLVSFAGFVDAGSYEMTTFTFGSHELRLLCLRAASS
jgi:hypothetical protein